MGEVIHTLLELSRLAFHYSYHCSAHSLQGRGHGGFAEDTDTERERDSEREREETGKIQQLQTGSEGWGKPLPWSTEPTCTETSKAYKSKRDLRHPQEFNML